MPDLPQTELRVFEHAIDRYIQKTGCSRSRESIAARIARYAANGRRIDSKRVYHRGWVLKIINNAVVTLYRPDQNWLRNRICNVMRQEKLELLKNTTLATSFVGL